MKPHILIIRHISNIKLIKEKNRKGFMSLHHLFPVLVISLLMITAFYPTHAEEESIDINYAVSKMMYEHVKELNLKAPCGLKKPIYIFEDDIEIADVFREYCGYEFGREMFKFKKIDFNRKGTYVYDIRRSITIGKPLLIKKEYFNKIKAGELFYAGVSRPYPYPKEKFYNKTEIGVNKSFSKIYYELWSRKTLDKPFWKVYYVVKKPRRIENLDFLKEGIVIFFFEKNSIIRIKNRTIVLNPFKPNPRYMKFSSIMKEKCSNCMPFFIEFYDDKIREGWVFGINCTEKCYGYKIIVYEYNKKKRNKEKKESKEKEKREITLSKEEKEEETVYMNATSRDEEGLKNLRSILLLLIILFLLFYLLKK